MLNSSRKRNLSSLPSPLSSGSFEKNRRREDPSSRDSVPRSKKRKRLVNEPPEGQAHNQRHNRPHQESGGGYERDSSLGDQAAFQSPEEQDPICHWATTGEWPTTFGTMGPSVGGSSSKRRRLDSYSSRTRDGSVPPAHTPAYEEELRSFGIMFDDMAARDMLDVKSKDMCQTLLSMEFESAYNRFSKDEYIRLWQRATKCNEERVRRDLTPFIVPSAELLYIIDKEENLKDIKEEMSVDWTKCGLLGGTQPRPDYAYGLSSATFTNEERAKLQNYANIDHPTKFTESMYFPFLLCEAKCGRKNINDADRQNVHSASIAVNAIVQLCRAADESSTESLSGQILVFSVSHDNERVKIYGHFPLIRDGQITFHRYYVHDYSLDGGYGRDRNTGSNFIRAVYRDFYPQHLRRIRDAIACLPDPRTTSMVSDISIGPDETGVSENSLQEVESPQRLPLRRAKSQGSQGELTMMKQHMAKVEQLYKAQLEQQREENQKQRELLEKLLEQQREENQKQRELLEKQLEQ